MSGIFYEIREKLIAQTTGQYVPKELILVLLCAQ